MTVRTRAERDATTVEMVYAFVSAIVLAGLAALLVAAPALFAAAPGPWLSAAPWVAWAVFLTRVPYVLLRWQRRQPSQPGRGR
ncbi:DUF6332 family protein [Streptomyces gobiensis]|uniref:DUF6332 family protein n=1 Tax=Streptomyces gobiensis TaxID=2875706 RepID=UPI001E5D93A5|nr:DUF6332 family protein [Streptomyces gobiensis]UGY94700.1 DUF6332 family protein [Streptomyces gobiensis]